MKNKKVKKRFLGGGYENFLADNQKRCERLFKVLNQVLLPLLKKDPDNLPRNLFVGKVTTFLTCLDGSLYLQENFLEKNFGELFTEAALNGLHKSLLAGINPTDLQILLKELPKIILLPYPAAKEIRSYCMIMIPKLMELYKNQITVDNMALHLWKKITDLDYISDYLQCFDKFDNK